MKPKSEKTKRKSRANVVLDEEDLRILFLLPSLPGFELLANIKNQIGLAHNTFLIHIKRLISHEFITLERSTNNRKVKIIHLTPLGQMIKMNLRYSPAIDDFLKKDFIRNILGENKS